MQAKWGQNCNWPGRKTNCQTTRPSYDLRHWGKRLMRVFHCVCVWVLNCLCVCVCALLGRLFYAQSKFANEKPKANATRKYPIKILLAFDLYTLHLCVCVCVQLYACLCICVSLSETHLHMLCQKRVLCTLKPSTGYIIFSGFQFLSARCCCCFCVVVVVVVVVVLCYRC